MIGPITIVFRGERHRCEISTSGDREILKRIADESEVIEGVEVPIWIEYDSTGGVDPDMHMRVELRDGSPVVTELSWKAQPHQSGIRQKHLRKTDPAKLATDLVVRMIEKPIDPSTANVAQLRETRRALRAFVERQQLPRSRRVMTPAFLQAVAQVYRENIDGKPTKAVGETFNVQSRMASKYVEVARQRGYLPQTERGKKKA